MTEYQVTLGSAPIMNDGRLRSKMIDVAHPDFTITSSGSWGGRLSSQADASGNPRLVAGTHGATAMTSGESKASFVGAFHGVTGR